MSLEIRVEEGGRPIGVFPLSDGKQLLGSSNRCPICIAHSEVAATAGSVEVAGGVVFFRNQNEFPIYIGANQLAPGGVAEWRPGDAIQLTRSIAMTLDRQSGEVVVDSGDDADSKNMLGSVIQVAVIIGSVGFSALMLAGDTDAGPSEDSSVIRFDELIQKFEEAGGPGLKNLKHEQRVLLNYVTEAKSLESRWGSDKKEDVLAAYELVLTTRTERGGDALEGLAREYAASRIDSLK